MEKIYSEALYDPAVAKEMADNFTGITLPTEIKAKRLNSRLFALGLPYSEEEIDKQTKEQ